MMTMIEHGLLNNFRSVSLSEIENVKFMERTDTKYVFHINSLPSVLEELNSTYQCLVTASQKVAAYSTLYYDSPDFHFYNQHHNGCLNRYKVRHRTYLNSGLGFLEVKQHRNTGITNKKRIEIEKAPMKFDEISSGFLSQHLKCNTQLLSPTIKINYNRITLVNSTGTERLTIDTNLEFEHGQQVIKPSTLVVAEIKRQRHSASMFSDIMKRKRIRESSFSKYCVGLVLTESRIKKNNFKEKIISLKNIISYDVIANCYRNF